jgi:hypothetical protein
MLAVAFDTLKLARKLESAGMPSKQAQDTSAALSETYTEWLSLGNVATREDVREVKVELEAKIDNVEARLETKIEAKKTEILYWMVGQTIVLLGALFALIHFPGAH